MTIALLGDSLLDTGNLTNVLTLFGRVPFPDFPNPPFSDPPYTGGKASNGLVLGEAVLAELGIDLGSLKLGFRLPFTPPSPNLLTKNINYAVAGATTGVFGSEGNELNQLPIGVQSQIALFKQDLASTRMPEAKSVKPDIIFSAGSNDIFEVLVDIQSFITVLLTPCKDDDNALKNDLATQVTGNIYAAIDSLESYSNNIVIFGLSKLGDSPFSIKVDGAVAYEASSLDGDLAGQTRAFLNSVAAEVNTRLIATYDGPNYRGSDFLFDDVAQIIGSKATRVLNDLEGFSPRAASFASSVLAGISRQEGTSFNPATIAAVGRALPTIGKTIAQNLPKYTRAVNRFDDLLGSNFFGQVNNFLVGALDNITDYLQVQKGGYDPVPNVMVIDGIDAFENGLIAWKESLSEAELVPVTEISYLDYLTQDTGLGEGLDSQSFAFTDGSHPTSNLNQFIAAQIAPQIQAVFPNFGMG
jgi:phospholipase/lecithinase/hemolysin